MSTALSRLRAVLWCLLAVLIGPALKLQAQASSVSTNQNADGVYRIIATQFDTRVGAFELGVKGVK